MNMKEVIEHLRLNGLHDEAAAVGVVMEQRAELIQALVEIADTEPDELQAFHDIANKALKNVEAGQ